MSRTIKIYAESKRGGKFPVEVTFSSYKGSRGYRNSSGVPEEPDEPGGIEIESITFIRGKKDISHLIETKGLEELIEAYDR